MWSHETEYIILEPGYGSPVRANLWLTNITGQADRSIAFFRNEGALFHQRWTTYTLNDTVLFPQRSFRGRYNSDFRKVSLFCNLSLVLCPAVSNARGSQLHQLQRSAWHRLKATCLLNKHWKAFLAPRSKDARNGLDQCVSHLKSVTLKHVSEQTGLNCFKILKVQHLKYGTKASGINLEWTLL